MPPRSHPPVVPLLPLVCLLVVTHAGRVRVAFHNETDHSHQKLTEGSKDCTDNDGIDIHQYFLTRSGRVLPATDLAPLVHAAGRNSAHTILDLDSEGIAIGHDARLQLRQTKHTTMDSLRSYAAVVEQVLNERHVGRCQRFQFENVRALYSNMVIATKDGSLLNITEGLSEEDGLGYPFAAQHRRDGLMRCDGGADCFPTAMHRDSDDRDDITFWAPVLESRPVMQFPLLFANTSTLVGLPSSNQFDEDEDGSHDMFDGRMVHRRRRGTDSRTQDDCYSLPLTETKSAGQEKQKTPTVELLYWSSMALGDYIIFDGLRLFHGSGELQGLPPGTFRGRTAVSIEYRCVTTRKGEQREDDGSGDESEEEETLGEESAAMSAEEKATALAAMSAEEQTAALAAMSVEERQKLFRHMDEV